MKRSDFYMNQVVMINVNHEHGLTHRLNKDTKTEI